MASTTRSDSDNLNTLFQYTQQQYRLLRISTYIITRFRFCLLIEPIQPVLENKYGKSYKIEGLFLYVRPAFLTLVSETHFVCVAVNLHLKYIRPRPGTITNYKDLPTYIHTEPL